VPQHRTTIDVAEPFELRLCLFGHGWIALRPHAFDEQRQRWTTVLRLGRAVVDARVRQRDGATLQVELDARTKLTASQIAEARRQLAHMLRLDDDLSEFHARCDEHAPLRWVARRGGGRLLRSPTVFEDLMKLLFTTNTTWASTEAMTNNLVDALGAKAASGARAFPTAKQCVRDEAFYRDVVRCGYRAQAALELAEAFATGALRDEHFLAPQPSDALWRRLCALRGFGPYAAGQAMRLCGHYDKLAIDSWCRARFAERARSGRAPSDAAIAREYSRFAPYDGLAMWCDLTTDWHERGRT